MGAANIHVASSGSNLPSSGGERESKMSSNRRKRKKAKELQELGGLSGKRSPVQMLTKEQIEEAKVHFD